MIREARHVGAGACDRPTSDIIRQVLRDARRIATSTGFSLGCRSRAASIATAVLLSSAANAQSVAESPSATDSQTSPSNVEEIVVTGTLLRGISPPGSQTLSITEEDAIATGATSTAQLLANVPQLGDFNSRPILQGALNVQQTVNHPDLRNLAASLGAGGSPTLLLLNGHRLPGMGVRQTTPDSDAIAPGAIERVEIVTDGGSSTYGADAVGGVVNYITRRRFDGVEAHAQYGFADDYETVGANLTVGKDWASGSLFATYSYAWHDEIFGRDRDFVQNRDWRLGVPADLTCNPANVSVGGTTYALPGLVAGLGNRCDAYDDATFYPSEQRNSVFVGFSQDLGDSVEIRTTGYYTNRLNVTNGGALTTSTTISAASPFYRSTGDANAGQTQTVFLNFEPLLGNSSRQAVELETWGIAPSVTANLGGGWQVRGLVNYGTGTSIVENQSINTAAFAALVAQGQVDPYDLSAAANAGRLGTVLDYGLYGKGVNDLTNVRVVADGSLFALPGGEARVAVGGEYFYETYDVQTGSAPRANRSLLPRGGSNRNTKAVFGEILVPIVGEGNRNGAIHALSFSASGRFDSYDDFGDTFNPKLALTYEPIDWIKLRGNWGESFQAPSLADGAGAIANTIVVLPRVFFPNPAVPPSAGQAQLFLTGGGVDLRPQTAKTWSVGTDIEPTFAPGLQLSGTYYDIKFTDLIAIAPVQNPGIFYSLYPDFYVINPTIDQIREFAAQAPGGLNAVAPYLQTPGQVYALSDGRRANFSNVNVSGVDFSARYDLPTGFGSAYARVSGNYVLTREEQTRTGAPFVDTRDNFTRLRLSATLGALIGDLRIQATLLHSSGFDVLPTAANLNQSQVDAFDVLNLFAEQQLNGSGLLSETSLTLNVDNVFDEDPPLYRGLNANSIGGGYANGFTLGRLVQFGVRKRF